MASLLPQKPHAVCISFPAQGHVNPMMQLANLLHSEGFHITFINSEFIHRRLLQSKGPDVIKDSIDFRFEIIPDGLPSSHTTNQDIPSVLNSIQKNLLAPLVLLLKKLNSSSDVPRISCVISDATMRCGVEAAEELGVHVIQFWPAAACSFMSVYHLPELIERGIVPLKDENEISKGYLDTTIDWIPGLRDIRLKDLFSFIRTTDSNDIWLNFLVDVAQSLLKATHVIFNTFDDLECEVLDAIACKIPCIYTVGPQSMIGEQLQKSETRSMRPSLWKEDLECLKWLDKMEPNSVLYVNFGSSTVMTDQQLREFACGLANSKHPFLWINRPNVMMGKSAILPSEFVLETKDRGYLASWCPQDQVLLHSSIGGFLTHCGWNSTIESICGGVPLLCWPFFADQQTNCKYACTMWGIGIEIDNNVKSEEVEILIKELMEGENGRNIKNKALEWKEKAQEATKQGGSSYNNFKRLICEILQPKESPFDVTNYHT
ncbi:hypothetical protein NE237_014616 [Protea cynaroides]|uniref:Glycosyltransferase n=1 Tax=Protea cynaroides TaxID=273540 RepID=A0A9Q0QQ59_9MAGN|nr:hypothetical protein NE237_014616 [Protea cynaroides]